MSNLASLRVAVVLYAATFPFAAASLLAQGGPPNLHASRVVAADDRGQAGGGIFAPANALGAPGTASVHSLGVGGSLTLGFDVVIQDRPGADLIVFENPFVSFAAPWETFAEVCFVEVSSNGVDFARVPARYTGPQVDPGSFAFVHSGYYDGLGGSLPVGSGGGDPRDLVAAGGDAIDLAGLGAHPLVQSGAVDLQAITQVRLVDVRSGLDVDAAGTPIRDAGAGSADIDAVTVLHHAGNATPQAPTVELVVPPSGAFSLTIRDADGLGDLAAVRVALWGIEVSAADLLAALQVQAAGPDSVTLGLAGALPPGLPLRLSASVVDRAGHHAGASATR